MQIVCTHCTSEPARSSKAGRTPGYGIRINNIEAWGGLMGPGYDYFERGNLDIFSGRGPCLTAPVCALNLTSDGSGSGHGWYCNYLEVTVTGVHEQCSQHYFEVEQWLATDASPHELTAIRNQCSSNQNEREIRDHGSSMVSVIWVVPGFYWARSWPVLFNMFASDRRYLSRSLFACVEGRKCPFCERAWCFN